METYLLSLFPNSIGKQNKVSGINSYIGSFCFSKLNKVKYSVITQGLDGAKQARHIPPLGWTASDVASMRPVICIMGVREKESRQMSESQGGGSNVHSQLGPADSRGREIEKYDRHLFKA